MVYFVTNPADRYRAWTAICRPPWVKALALWRAWSSWRGGGVFVGPQEVLLDVPEKRKRKRGDPGVMCSFRTDDLFDVHACRLRRDGWVQESAKDSAWQKVGPDEVQIRYTPPHYDFSAGGLRRGRCSLRSPDGSTLPGLGRAQWADWDLRGRLIAAGEDGVIRRYTSDGAAKGGASLEVDANLWLPPPPQ